MLSLADTSIRMYRKKNGGISYRLRSYLLINSNVGFSLEAYLKSISAELMLPTGDVIPLDVSYSIDTIAEYRLNTMTHRFSARGDSSKEEMRNSVGKLRIDYHLSFTGHPSEEPKSIELAVPLVVKSTQYKGQ